MADLFAGEPVQLERMLGSVRRELALRRRVFPRLVEGGRMKQDESNAEIATMEALESMLETLVARRITVQQLLELRGHG